MPFAVPHVKPASPTDSPRTLTGYFCPRYVNIPEPQLNPIPAATEPCDSSSVAAGIQSCAPAGPTTETRPPSTSAITSRRMTISSPPAPVSPNDLSARPWGCPGLVEGELLRCALLAHALPRLVDRRSWGQCGDR